MKSLFSVLVLALFLATIVHSSNAFPASPGESAFIELETRESQLRTDYEKLMRAGFSAGQVVRQLEEKLKSGDTDAEAAWARDVDSAYLRFEQDYDTLSRQKLDYLIDRAFAIAQAARDEGGPSTAKAFAELEEIYREYEGYRDLYGSPKDYLRITSYGKFFARLGRFNQAAEHARTGVRPGWRERLRAWLAGLREINISARDQVGEIRLAPTKILRVVPAFFRAYQTLLRERISPPGQTPVVNSIDAVMRELGELQKVSVEVSGKENIPVSSDPKELNFFVLPHQNPMLDMIALAHLGLSPYAIYGAADHFARKPVADKLDETDHFIVVGRGSDKPIEKTFSLLERDKVRSFVIFPEGSISTGFYDARPLREKFSWGLLARLRAAGYHVNLVPVGLPDNLNFGNDWEPPGHAERRRVRAIIHRAIPAEVVDALVRTQGDQAINRLVRMFFLEDFPTDGAHLIGAPPVGELRERIDRSYFALQAERVRALESGSAARGRCIRALLEARIFSSVTGSGAWPDRQSSPEGVGRAR